MKSIINPLIDYGFSVSKTVVGCRKINIFLTDTLVNTDVSIYAPEANALLHTRIYLFLLTFNCQMTEVLAFKATKSLAGKF